MKWSTTDYKRVNDYKHDRQCTYNETLKLVGATTVAVVKQ